MSFGKTLKALRTEKGWTQSELAEKIGVAKKTISFYEVESRKPSRITLMKLAELFEVTLDMLVGDELIKNEPIRNSEPTRDIKKILVSLGVFGEDEAITKEQYDKWLKFIQLQATAFRDLNNNSF